MNPSTYLRWAARQPSAAEVYADCRGLQRDERAEALTLLLDLYGEDWLRDVARQIRSHQGPPCAQAASNALSGAIYHHLATAQ